MQLTALFVSLLVTMAVAAPVANPDPQITRPNCRLARDADPQVAVGVTLPKKHSWCRPQVHMSVCQGKHE
ncbi:hypothetical protein ACET3X_004761 [Alternaria dauci]|uniref:Uncharacterized protein n=1 Tax=Alternaria dauci TaxID=48095 RepID=A0ABR3UL15_9PLEO